MATACFYTRTPAAYLDKQQYEGVDVQILTDLGFKVTVAHRYADIPDRMDLYYSWWASGSILSMIKAKLSGRPNIAVAGGNEAMIYRDSLSGEPYGYLAKSMVKRLATRTTLRHSSRILMVSEYMRENLVALGARSPGYAPNCVDTELFKDQGRERRHILSIFSQDRASVQVKRAENIIRAGAAVCRAHPGLRLLLAGREGDGTPLLRNLVTSIGAEKSVIFTGEVPNNRIPELMSASVAYVQPSDTETFGVAVAEAMSCGTPVVVSRRGALPEVVGDLGFYVDQNDPLSIARGIEVAVALTPADRHSLGTRLRGHVMSKYTIDHRKAAIKAVLDSVL